MLTSKLTYFKAQMLTFVGKNPTSKEKKPGREKTTAVRADTVTKLQ